ncbi:thiamine ABC transporter substrate-binding protein [Tamaricihabitans halophyticus]|uniref:thiamine ABC transporter substrate-binding protein n=1 Tax=Tamaricihabitans halophyticus TaxID=1262583 RepID=UPI001FB25B62|nr:thiamine ABC transporter substrate-binding protein [Tamaricihabitans halophyticus]
MPKSRLLTSAVSLFAIGALTGCTLIGDTSQPESNTVTLVTHDSWAAPQQVLDEFERESGITIKVNKSGDAGELTNKLVLTKDNPIGDIAYGVDSTFASRALDEEVFATYRSPHANSGPQRYDLDEQHRLTAVDVGDVCVNIDTEFFAEAGLPEPENYRDLANPRYRDQLVVPDAATSSPGLAFLLGTIAEFGGGWAEYWGELKANGVQVVSGWEEAYGQEFSGSAEQGSRPIVVSYASSPAAEVSPDGSAPTRALPETCYRQVEYAGVLAGTPNTPAARTVLDFLLSEPFQRSVAESMYVYPARADVDLPESWAEVAPLPDKSSSLPAEQVQRNREQWVAQWRELVQE